MTCVLAVMGEENVEKRPAWGLMTPCSALKDTKDDRRSFVKSHSYIRKVRTFTVLEDVTTVPVVVSRQS